MGSSTRESSDAPVRAVLDDWAEAIRRKDIERLMAHYAPDMTGFDAWGPLRIDGPTHRDHWEQCFAGHEGPIEYEYRELVIHAGEDVAFAHCLIGMSGTLIGGSRHSFWGRGTIGFRKSDGRWLIVHEHASAPFDPYTNEACTNLQP